MSYICRIFGHPRYRVLRTSQNGTMQKLQCVRCKRLFGINHTVRMFIPWDSELEALMREDHQEKDR